MNTFLSEEQRDQLRKQHKQERDKRICDRIKAVLLSPIQVRSATFAASLR